MFSQIEKINFELIEFWLYFIAIEKDLLILTSYNCLSIKMIILNLLLKFYLINVFYIFWEEYYTIPQGVAFRWTIVNITYLLNYQHTLIIKFKFMHLVCFCFYYFTINWANYLIFITLSIYPLNWINFYTFAILNIFFQSKYRIFSKYILYKLI